MWWRQRADPVKEHPPPPPPPIEEGNLKDQFQHIRDQIEELKELLKKNEEKQVTREKEVEKYASILLDIKSRSKAATSTPKQEAQEQETETPKIEETFEEASTPRKSSSAKKTRGNLVLLLKKLEENRAKYELRCKELSENKKRIEEKLQHFETQLDERDVYIKESQKVVEASQSPVTSSEASEDVLEAFDETQDLHAQVTHRDNVNMELKKKIVYLKTIVYDLQESFLEKDSVIAALTKAITLLSEDFSRRNKTAVDNLEETREEMRMMENTFVEKEVSLNNEMEELRKEIAAKNLRLHQLEENNKELQSVQFDLSTRNAELQEKVVRMLELTMQLQKQVAEQEEKLQHNEEAEKLKSQLDDAQKQMTKMKTQHKTKQLDALKKMSDANEEILKLQNKIAELEEDKAMWWRQRADPVKEHPPPPPPPIEEGNLRDQFQHIRDQIEELKELLKKNEEKQVTREKEVEKYASILLDIKSRSKAATSTPKQEAQEQETETPKIEETFEEASTPRKSSSAKKTRGNLVLLLKKLEENRAKYELRCKELSENKKRIEEKLQHFETQLDERDVYIKESQKVVEASQSPVTSSEASEDVLEAFDETQDLHAQVTHRDNVNVELKKKIVYLKTIVYDLQESFHEKDSVIAARTKAITLMSKDFSRRNKTAVDNLEETREEMRKMENTFVEKEVSLNNEMEELRKEIAAKNLRLHQLEENNKELHSVQFDLSTRNAELQEKVVRMQELTMQFQKQVAEQEEKLQHNEEAEKLKSQLDDAQKQMTKMKAQQKKKQLDALKKMSDANEEILKLQNKIAELEEDKVSESHWQTRVNELEERVAQQNQDLDSHVLMISLLEMEKLDHLKNLDDRIKMFETYSEEEEMALARLQEKLNAQEHQKEYVTMNLNTKELGDKISNLNAVLERLIK